MVAENVHVPKDLNVLVEEIVNEAFDFEKMATNWFTNVDDKRENFFTDPHIDKEGKEDGLEDAETTNPNIVEWLR